MDGWMEWYLNFESWRMSWSRTVKNKRMDFQAEKITCEKTCNMKVWWNYRLVQRVWSVEWVEKKVEVDSGEVH